MRISSHRLAWTAAAVCLWALATGVASAQTPSCQVTYTKSWEGGNGFGANIVITNNGPAITNGWTLIFSFPNGQRLQNGWPVSFTQPAGSAQMTVASNADWNKSIGSGGSFTAGFNGTFSGTNNSPTAFTLNGTACNGGTTPPTNTPPNVALTSPTSGQQIRQWRDDSAGGDGQRQRLGEPRGVPRRWHSREHRHHFALQLHQSGARGRQSHGAGHGVRQRHAAAVDCNGADSVHGAGGAHGRRHRREPGHAEHRGRRHRHLERAALGSPTANVVVTLTRSGSTVITSNPGTVTLTTGNWSTGVNVTFTAAAGTTAATSTFAAAAPNYTGATITVNRTATTNPGTRVDNPYSGAGVYNNPHMARERGGRWRQLHRQPADGGVVRPHQRDCRQWHGTTGSMGPRAASERGRDAGCSQRLGAAGVPDRDLRPAGPRLRRSRQQRRARAERPAALQGGVHRSDRRDPGAARICRAAHRRDHRDRLAAEPGDQHDRSCRPAPRSATS